MADHAAVNTFTEDFPVVIQAEHETVTLKVGEGEESFSILLAKPSKEAIESLVQEAMQALMSRLSLVAGWSDVQTTEGPVPFSRNALLSAVNLNPPFATAMVEAINRQLVEWTR